MENAGRGVPYIVGLVGAAVGGAVGLVARAWLLRWGLDALILPGALVGLGCGLGSRRRSWLLGITSGLGGLGAGLYSEWWCCPFIADDGPLFFLTHLHQLRTAAQIMILVGAILGFWFGLGWSNPPARATREPESP